MAECSVLQCAVKWDFELVLCKAGYWVEWKVDKKDSLLAVEKVVKMVTYLVAQ